MTSIAAEGIGLRFDARTGLPDDFAVVDEGAEIAPLHRAPWVRTTGEAMPPDAEPHMATLGGDFFCAPFAAREDNSPFQRWPPNSPWRVLQSEWGTLRAILERPVHGATLIKELSLRDGHSFVYQRHIFVGGEGRISVSNHANVSLKNGGIIRTSPKRFWETPFDPQESDPARGRSNLLYPARSEDPRCFPGRDGPVDLTRYPWKTRHEDLVAAVERADHTLGWTAVARPKEGDLFLSLRNARELPMTMLWHSDGGRDYAPWSGRHFGCLGVEQGAADHLLGMSTEAGLSGPGAATLTAGGTVEIRHVLGAIRWPARVPVADIRVADGAVEIHGESGTARRLPFHVAFLRLAVAGPAGSSRSKTKAENGGATEMLRAVMAVIAAARAISIDEELAKRRHDPWAFQAHRSARQRRRPAGGSNSGGCYGLQPAPDQAPAAAARRTGFVSLGRWPSAPHRARQKNLRNSAGRNIPLLYRPAGRPELRTPR